MQFRVLIISSKALRGIRLGYLTDPILIRTCVCPTCFHGESMIQVPLLNLVILCDQGSVPFLQLYLFSGMISPQFVRDPQLFLPLGKSLRPDSSPRHWGQRSRSPLVFFSYMICQQFIFMYYIVHCYFFLF